MTELLPCPFCGGEAALYERTSDRQSYVWYEVLCVDSSCGDCGDTREAAIAAWNRRAPESKDE